MRIRSPSNAPPDLRRDGSTEITAMVWRRPVEPEAADQLVGQRRLAGAAGAGDAERRDHRLVGRAESASRSVANVVAGRAGSRPEVLERRDQLRELAAMRPRMPSSVVGAPVDRSTSQRSIRSRIIPGGPSAGRPRGVDALTPYACSSAISEARIVPPPPREHLDVRAAGRAAGRSCT